MALVDLCKVQILSTGTGPLALGSAVLGYDGLDALTDGLTYSYAIQQDANWEYGLGTYVASGPTMVRAPIKSSYGLATAIPLSGGAQVVFTALAEDFTSAIDNLEYSDIVRALTYVPVSPGQLDAGLTGLSSGNALIFGEYDPDADNTNVPVGIDLISLINAYLASLPDEANGGTVPAAGSGLPYLSGGGVKVA